MVQNGLGFQMLDSLNVSKSYQYTDNKNVLTEMNGESLIQSIIPNPTTGLSHVLLHFSSKGKCEILVYDQLYRTVFKESTIVNQTSTIDFSVDLSSYKSGLYFLVDRFEYQQQVVSEQRKIFLVN